MRGRIKAYWVDIPASRRRIVKPLLGALLGGALGFTYYAFVGCASGACPLTSDPFITTAWGAAIGGLATAG